MRHTSEPATATEIRNALGITKDDVELVRRAIRRVQQMKVWLLRPIDEDSPASAWKPWYDNAFGFVIRAEDAFAARLLASARHGDEGGAAWLDERQSTCEELTGDGESGIILSDFRSA